MNSSVARTTLWPPLSVAQEPYAASEAAAAPAVVARPSDEDLLALMQSGDTGALGTLFDRYARLVLTIGSRALKDRTEAEDLVQDVFLHINKTCRNYDPAKGAARTWIVHLAYCRAFDRRAYLARRGFYAGTELSSVNHAQKEASSLEDQVSVRVSGERVHRAFEELTEKQKITLELFFFEGYTFREIAERMGDTLENIRHHYYRGMERLHACEAVKALRSAT